MLKRRLLDVYSAAPARQRVDVDGYEFAELLDRHFESAEFCRPRLSLFRERLAEGFAAYGLLTADGELAYYMWLSYGDGKGWAPWTLGARINLPASSGYIFDCKTAPEHRNKGLYSAALKHARWLCHKSGCEKVLIDVEPQNEPAVKAIKNAGFKMLATTKVARFGPIVRTKSGTEGSFGWKQAAYAF